VAAHTRCLGALVAACRLLAGMARPGCRGFLGSLPCCRTANTRRMVWSGGKDPAGSRRALRARAVGFSGLSVPCRLGRDDRHRLGAAFWLVPLAVMRLALRRSGCEAADELAFPLGQRQRFLGPALEHRLP